jgi:hypothetical protein
MILSNRMKRPSALIPISMMFLVTGLLLPEFHQPTTQIGQNSIHAVRGLLVGISIGIGLMSVILASRQRRRSAGK